MAEGYARASGKPGVVLVTSGPGATNVITPMQDALSDGTPLVVFSGQVVTSAIGTDAFQEADIVGISRACTKWNIMVKNLAELVCFRSAHILVETPVFGTQSNQNLKCFNKSIPVEMLTPRYHSPSELMRLSRSLLADGQDQSWWICPRTYVLSLAAHSYTDDLIDSRSKPGSCHTPFPQPLRFHRVPVLQA